MAMTKKTTSDRNRWNRRVGTFDHIEKKNRDKKKEQKVVLLTYFSSILTKILTLQLLLKKEYIFLIKEIG